MAHMIFEFKDLLILAVAVISGWNFFVSKKVEYKLSAVLGEDKHPTTTDFDLSSLTPISQGHQQQQQQHHQDPMMMYQQQQQHQQMQQYYQEQQQQQQVPEQSYVTQEDSEEEKQRKKAAEILQRSGVSKLVMVAPQEAEGQQQIRPLEANRDQGNAGMDTYSHLAKISKPFVFGSGGGNHAN